MALIALEGMRFYAHHGVYEAERLIPTEFVVDVYIQSPAVNIAAMTDDVSQTINYETVYQICRLEMAQPRNLIEAVSAGIFKRLKHHFPNMASAKVRVRKLNPPLGGRVASSMVEDEETYLSVCPRCQKPFIHYNLGDCWERIPNVHPATKETLQRQFGGKCLCESCLGFYAG
jgi:7,8-dihydroneopterin aldolase/epimerase/oxygenase